jgi:hypothetical protein
VYFSNFHPVITYGVIFWGNYLTVMKYSLDERIIIEYILGIYNGKMWLDWMYLVQDREVWCVLVNMVMNLLVP